MENECENLGFREKSVHEAVRARLRARVVRPERRSAGGSGFRLQVIFIILR